MDNVSYETLYFRWTSATSRKLFILGLDFPNSIASVYGAYTNCIPYFISSKYAKEIGLNLGINIFSEVSINIETMEHFYTPYGEKFLTSGVDEQEEPYYKFTVI